LRIAEWGIEKAGHIAHAAEAQPLSYLYGPPYGPEAGPVEDPAAGGQRYSALPVKFPRSDGVLEYWSDGLSLVNSMHQRISMASV